ncbi:hypothetical protein MATL_G00070980 [Megalops atlanticus]|uniref:Uncharacterized protein n=1 Tax=Megalops atlanticus TaxID=7932 RepID=A0A9D3T839_MEGAT|nr:hypothetical protein MATL_G00070980 [Megalops atlanticus]
MTSQRERRPRGLPEILLDWRRRTPRDRDHAATVTDAGVCRGLSLSMDDLDYSVHIAEQDWDSFFQESEECDLRQAALAGLDESGLSDFDESECLLGSRRSMDGATDFTGPSGTLRARQCLQRENMKLKPTVLE